MKFIKFIYLRIKVFILKTKVKELFLLCLLFFVAFLQLFLVISRNTWNQVYNNLKKQSNTETPFTFTFLNPIWKKIRNNLAKLKAIGKKRLKLSNQKLNITTLTADPNFNSKNLIELNNADNVQKILQISITNFHGSTTTFINAFMQAVNNEINYELGQEWNDLQNRWEELSALSLSQLATNNFFIIKINPWPIHIATNSGLWTSWLKSHTFASQLSSPSLTQLYKLKYSKNNGIQKTLQNTQQFQKYVLIPTLKTAKRKKKIMMLQQLFQQLQIIRLSPTQIDKQVVLAWILITDIGTVPTWKLSKKIEQKLDKIAILPLLQKINTYLKIHIIPDWNRVKTKLSFLNSSSIIVNKKKITFTDLWSLSLQPVSFHKLQKLGSLYSSQFLTNFQIAINKALNLKIRHLQALQVNAIKKELTSHEWNWEVQQAFDFLASIQNQKASELSLPQVTQLITFDFSKLNQKIIETANYKKNLNNQIDTWEKGEGNELLQIKRQNWISWLQQKFIIHKLQKIATNQLFWMDKDKVWQWFNVQLVHNFINLNLSDWSLAAKKELDKLNTFTPQEMDTIINQHFNSQFDQQLSMLTNIWLQKMNILQLKLPNKVIDIRNLITKEVNVASLNYPDFLTFIKVIQSDLHTLFYNAIESKLRKKLQKLKTIETQLQKHKIKISKLYGILAKAMQFLKKWRKAKKANIPMNRSDLLTLNLPFLQKLTDKIINNPKKNQQLFPKWNKQHFLHSASIKSQKRWWKLLNWNQALTRLNLLNVLQIIFTDSQNSSQHSVSLKGFFPYANKSFAELPIRIKNKLKNFKNANPNQVFSGIISKINIILQKSLNTLQAFRINGENLQITKLVVDHKVIKIKNLLQDEKTAYQLKMGSFQELILLHATNEVTKLLTEVVENKLVNKLKKLQQVYAKYEDKDHYLFHERNRIVGKTFQIIKQWQKQGIKQLSAQQKYFLIHLDVNFVADSLEYQKKLKIKNKEINKLFFWKQWQQWKILQSDNRLSKLTILGVSALTFTDQKQQKQIVNLVSLLKNPHYEWKDLTTEMKTELQKFLFLTPQQLITIIADALNNKEHDFWQKWGFFQQQLATLKIDQLLLEPQQKLNIKPLFSAPRQIAWWTLKQLNLFMKLKTLDAQKLFNQTIDQHFNKTWTTLKSQLDKLLTLKIERLIITHSHDPKQRVVLYLKQLMLEKKQIKTSSLSNLALRELNKLVLYDGSLVSLIQQTINSKFQSLLNNFQQNKNRIEIARLNSLTLKQPDQLNAQFHLNHLINQPLPLKVENLTIPQLQQLQQWEDYDFQHLVAVNIKDKWNEKFYQFHKLKKMIQIQEISLTNLTTASQEAFHFINDLDREKVNQLDNQQLKQLVQLQPDLIINKNGVKTKIMTKDFYLWRFWKVLQTKQRLDKLAIVKINKITFYDQNNNFRTINGSILIAERAHSFLDLSKNAKKELTKFIYLPNEQNIANLIAQIINQQLGWFWRELKTASPRLAIAQIKFLSWSKKSVYLNYFTNSYHWSNPVDFLNLNTFQELAKFLNFKQSVLTLANQTIDQKWNPKLMLLRELSEKLDKEKIDASQLEENIKQAITFSKRIGNQKTASQLNAKDLKILVDLYWKFVNMKKNRDKPISPWLFWWIKFFPPYDKSWPNPNPPKPDKDCDLINLNDECEKKKKKDSELPHIPELPDGFDSENNIDNTEDINDLLIDGDEFPRQPIPIKPVPNKPKLTPKTRPTPGEKPKLTVKLTPETKKTPGSNPKLTVKLTPEKPKIPKGPREKPKLTVKLTPKTRPTSTPEGNQNPGTKGTSGGDRTIKGPPGTKGSGQPSGGVEKTNTGGDRTIKGPSGTNSKPKVNPGGGTKPTSTPGGNLKPGGNPNPGSNPGAKSTSGSGGQPSGGSSTSETPKTGGERPKGPSGTKGKPPTTNSGNNLKPGGNPNPGSNPGAKPTPGGNPSGGTSTSEAPKTGGERPKGPSGTNSKPKVNPSGGAKPTPGSNPGGGTKGATPGGNLKPGGNPNPGSNSGARPTPGGNPSGGTSTSEAPKTGGERPKGPSGTNSKPKVNPSGGTKPTSTPGSNPKPGGNPNPGSNSGARPTPGSGGQPSGGVEKTNTGGDRTIKGPSGTKGSGQPKPGVKIPGTTETPKTGGPRIPENNKIPKGLKPAGVAGAGAAKNSLGKGGKSSGTGASPNSNGQPGSGDVSSGSPGNSGGSGGGGGGINLPTIPVVPIAIGVSAIIVAGLGAAWDWFADLFSGSDDDDWVGIEKDDFSNPTFEIDVINKIADISKEEKYLLAWWIFFKAKNRLDKLELINHSRLIFVGKIANKTLIPQIYNLNSELLFANKNKKFKELTHNVKSELKKCLNWTFSKAKKEIKAIFDQKLGKQFQDLKENKNRLNKTLITKLKKKPITRLLKSNFNLPSELLFTDFQLLAIFVNDNVQQLIDEAINHKLKKHWIELYPNLKRLNIAQIQELLFIAKKNWDMELDEEQKQLFTDLILHSPDTKDIIVNLHQFLKQWTAISGFQSPATFKDVLLLQELTKFQFSPTTILELVNKAIDDKWNNKFILLRKFVANFRKNDGIQRLKKQTKFIIYLVQQIINFVEKVKDKKQASNLNLQQLQTLIDLEIIAFVDEPTAKNNDKNHPERNMDDLWLFWQILQTQDRLEKLAITEVKEWFFSLTKIKKLKINFGLLANSYQEKNFAKLPLLVKTELMKFWKLTEPIKTIPILVNDALNWHLNTFWHALQKNLIRLDIVQISSLDFKTEEKKEKVTVDLKQFQIDHYQREVADFTQLKTFQELVKLKQLGTSIPQLVHKINKIIKLTSEEQKEINQTILNLVNKMINQKLQKYFLDLQNQKERINIAKIWTLQLNTNPQKLLYVGHLLQHSLKTKPSQLDNMDLFDLVQLVNQNLKTIVDQTIDLKWTPKLKEKFWTKMNKLWEQMSEKQKQVWMQEGGSIQPYEEEFAFKKELQQNGIYFKELNISEKKAANLFRYLFLNALLVASKLPNKYLQTLVNLNSNFDFLVLVNPEIKNVNIFNDDYDLSLFWKILNDEQRLTKLKILALPELSSNNKDGIRIQMFYLNPYEGWNFSHLPKTAIQELKKFRKLKTPYQIPQLVNDFLDKHLIKPWNQLRSLLSRLKITQINKLSFVGIEKEKVVINLDYLHIESRNTKPSQFFQLETFIELVKLFKHDENIPILVNKAINEKLSTTLKTIINQKERLNIAQIRILRIPNSQQRVLNIYHLINLIPTSLPSQLSDFNLSDVTQLYGHKIPVLVNTEINTRWNWKLKEVQDIAKRIDFSAIDLNTLDIKTKTAIAFVKKMKNQKNAGELENPDLQELINFDLQLIFMKINDSLQDKNINVREVIPSKPTDGEDSTPTFISIGITSVVPNPIDGEDSTDDKDKTDVTPLQPDKEGVDLNSKDGEEINDHKNKNRNENKNTTSHPNSDINPKDKNNNKTTSEKTNDKNKNLPIDSDIGYRKIGVVSFKSSPNKPSFWWIVILIIIGFNSLYFRENSLQSIGNQIIFKHKKGKKKLLKTTKK